MEALFCLFCVLNLRPVFILFRNRSGGKKEGRGREEAAKSGRSKQDGLSSPTQAAFTMSSKTEVSPTHYYSTISPPPPNPLQFGVCTFTSGAERVLSFREGERERNRVE